MSGCQGRDRLTTVIHSWRRHQVYNEAAWDEILPLIVFAFYLRSVEWLGGVLVLMLRVIPCKEMGGVSLVAPE